jgi:hypothetical protein
VRKFVPRENANEAQLIGKELVLKKLSRQRFQPPSGVNCYFEAHESQCPLGLTVALKIWHCPQAEASPLNNPQFPQV